MTHHFSCFCSYVRNFSGNLPSGYRFSPTVEELFHFYLIPKRLGHPIDGIAEIDLYRYNPWDIPDIDPTNKKLCDQVWYFFCIREYHNNDSFKRKAGSGFWKSTGNPRSVTAEGSEEEIGTVRILVFCNPNATHWLMDEFEHKAQSNSHVKDNYVLCRIRLQPNKKNKAVKRPRKSEPRCKSPNPKKKAREGKSNCNRASASTTAAENQNSTEMLPSSNYHKGAAAATYGKGESSNSDAYYIFKNQNDDSTYNEGEMRCLVASDSKNYKPSCCTAPACSENQNSCPMNFGNENRNSNEIMSIFPPNNKVETSHPMNLGNENLKNKMTHDHQSFGPVTSGNESLSQGVDIPISHQRPLLISKSEEVMLQEKQTDEHVTLDTSRRYFNFQGNRTDESIWMPPNGGEVMSAQVDPELAEADWEAALLESLHSAPDEQPISFGPVTSGNESLSQGVDIPISHQRTLLISKSEEVKLQEKQTDEYATLDTSRSYFNFQGNRTYESIWMPPNGGEAMSAQVDLELAEDWEAFKQLLETLYSAPDEQPISDEENPK